MRTSTRSRAALTSAWMTPTASRSEMTRSISSPRPFRASMASAGSSSVDLSPMGSPVSLFSPWLRHSKCTCMVLVASCKEFWILKQGLAHVDRSTQARRRRAAHRMRPGKKN